jgi:hypothetical protein
LCFAQADVSERPGIQPPCGWIERVAEAVIADTVHKNKTDGMTLFD